MTRKRRLLEGDSASLVSDESQSAKLMAHTLARFMDGDGDGAFPSIWKLSVLAGFKDERTAQKAIATLVEHKWLKTDERTGADGSRTTNNYRAKLPPNIFNSGKSPLHDKDLWAARYPEARNERNREKSRAYRARQREWKASSPADSPPSIPPSDAVRDARNGGARKTPLEVTQYEDTPLGANDENETNPKQSGSHEIELVWNVDTDLKRAAARWQMKQINESGLSLQDLPSTKDLVNKYRCDFADLVARCENEHWEEG